MLTRALDAYPHDVWTCTHTTPTHTHTHTHTHPHTNTHSDILGRLYYQVQSTVSWVGLFHIPLVEYPSCRQVTLPSATPNPLEQTVPHWPCKHTSTRPATTLLSGSKSRARLSVPFKRMSPSVQSAGGEGRIRGSNYQNILHQLLRTHERNCKAFYSIGAYIQLQSHIDFTPYLVGWACACIT